MRYANRKALVTGAAGYIGRPLIDALLASGAGVTAAVRARNAELPPSIRQIEGDIREESAWREWLPEQDVVFHLAGQTSHYAANRDPVGDWAANAEPILKLIRACEGLAARPRVVFASSATVYGLTANLPVDESRVPAPVTIYDAHKLAGETYLGCAARLDKLEAVSLRLANVYGLSSSTAHSDRGVLNMMALRALRGQGASVFGSGEWLRDYIELEDVVSALLAAGSAPIGESNGASFNIATGTGTRFIDAVVEVLACAERITGTRVPLSHAAPDPEKTSPIDERQFIGDSRSFGSWTGWAPQVTLRSGVEKLVFGLAARIGPKQAPRQ